MKIIDKIFNIEFKKPLNLECIENYFKAHKIVPVRFAVVEVLDNTLVVSAAIEDVTENPIEDSSSPA